MKKYFTHSGSDQQGPFDIADLKAQKIGRDTLIWFEGIGNWTKAGDITELQSLFTAIPPLLNTQTPPPVTNTTVSPPKKPINWTKWIVWVIIGIISLVLAATTEGAALVIILPAIGLYFVWKKFGGLKVFSILSLILSVAGIIFGLALAVNAKQFRYDFEIDLSQLSLMLGVGIAIYSIYFLAYSITVLASVRESKVGQYETK